MTWDVSSANLSYSYQRTNPTNQLVDESPRPNNASKMTFKQGYGLSRISMLPKDYGRLELNSRWFDQN